MNDYFLLLLYVLFFGFLTAFIASFKNRDIKQWFWIGALLGIFASIILLFQDPIREDLNETDTD